MSDDSGPTRARDPITRVGRKPIELTPAIRDSLLRSAAIGLPKRIAANQARIGYTTLKTWLASEVEPFASFAIDYRAAMAGAAEQLWPAAVEKDPWRALAVVHGVGRKEMAGGGTSVQVAVAVRSTSLAELEAELDRRVALRADAEVARRLNAPVEE